MDNRHQIYVSDVLTVARENFTASHEDGIDRGLCQIISRTIGKYAQDIVTDENAAKVKSIFDTPKGLIYGGEIVAAFIPEFRPSEEFAKDVPRELWYRHHYWWPVEDYESRLEFITTLIDNYTASDVLFDEKFIMEKTEECLRIIEDNKKA